MRAVVMLSGGLDSATVAAMAQDQGYEVVAISFDYGQRHRSELVAAAAVARALNIADHRTVTLDLRTIGGSALTDTIAVPKSAPPPDGEEIPVTYVPARNSIFLSIALGLAEVVGARHLFFGANALDYSGYPDCPPGVRRGLRAAGQRGDEGRGSGRGIHRARPADAYDQSRDHSGGFRPRRRLCPDALLLRFPTLPDVRVVNATPADCVAAVSRRPASPTRPGISNRSLESVSTPLAVLSAHPG